jgi:hypothetical protein
LGLATTATEAECRAGELLAADRRYRLGLTLGATAEECETAEDAAGRRLGSALAARLGLVLPAQSGSTAADLAKAERAVEIAAKEAAQKRWKRMRMRNMMVQSLTAPSLTALQSQLRDGDVQARRSAVQALAALGRQALIHEATFVLALSDAHESVLLAAADALKEIGRLEAHVPVLATRLRAGLDDSPLVTGKGARQTASAAGFVRAAAAKAFGMLEGAALKANAGVLEAAVKDTYAGCRWEAAAALGHLEGRALEARASLFARLLIDDEGLVRYHAAHALQGMSADAIKPYAFDLAGCLRDEDEMVCHPPPSPDPSPDPPPMRPRLRPSPSREVKYGLVAGAGVRWWSTREARCRPAGGVRAFAGRGGRRP